MGMLNFFNKKNKDLDGKIVVENPIPKEENFMSKLNNGIFITEELIFFTKYVAICEKWDDTFKDIYEPKFINERKYKEVSKYFYDEKDIENFKIRNFEYNKDEKYSWIDIYIDIENEYNNIENKHFLDFDLNDLQILKELKDYLSPKIDKYIEYLVNKQLEDRATQAIFNLPFYNLNPKYEFKNSTFQNWAVDNKLTIENDIHPKLTEFANKMKYLYEYINKNPQLNIIIFDIETTGTDIENDYVLSLGIIDYQGNILFNEMFKPHKKTIWTDASMKNGIWYEDVADKKEILEYKEQIQNIFGEADMIIGYNHEEFDIPILNNKKNKLNISMKKDVILIDVMKIVSNMIGPKNSIFHDYNFVKLVDAYEHFVRKKFDVHNCISDANATLEVFKNLV